MSPQFLEIQQLTPNSAGIRSCLYFFPIRMYGHITILRLWIEPQKGVREIFLNSNTLHVPDEVAKAVWCVFFVGFFVTCIGAFYAHAPLAPTLISNSALNH